MKWCFLFSRDAYQGWPICCGAVAADDGSCDSSCCCSKCCEGDDGSTDFCVVGESFEYPQNITLVRISIETSFETHAEETTAGVKKNGEEYRRLSAEEKGILFADSSLVYANMESHSVPSIRKRKSILIGDC